METRGHEVRVTARDKEVTQNLLKAYNIPYTLIEGKKHSLIQEWISRDIQMAKFARKSNPDIFLGVLNPVTAHSAKVLRKPSITLNDTEHAKIGTITTLPFTTVALTPSCFLKNIGKKQIRYNSYHELAYLHPDYFTPNPAVLNELDLKREDTFMILRFVSWNASHDKGQSGIKEKIKFVSDLKQYGRVFITSENTLPRELEHHRIQVSPEKLHDLLYYAALYVGEGGTMAAEAAVLGTPSIFVSSLAGTMGNFIELEDTYDLLYSFTDSDAAFVRAAEILRNSSCKEAWRMKLERLLNDKIDITAFMVWFTENYPLSIAEMKKHPGIQYFCTSDSGDAQ